MGPEELVPIAGGPGRKFERDAYFSLIPATKAGWLKRQGGVWTLTAEGREAIGNYTEPFSSCVCLADLQYVDGLGELSGAPGAAAELAEDPPGLELGVRPLAG